MFERGSVFNISATRRWSIDNILYTNDIEFKQLNVHNSTRKRQPSTKHCSETNCKTLEQCK